MKGHNVQTKKRPFDMSLKSLFISPLHKSAVQAWCSFLQVLKQVSLAEPACFVCSPHSCDVLIQFDMYVTLDFSNELVMVF